MNRSVFLTQTRTAVRVVLYSALGTATVAGAGFAGAHIYLESKDPTPKTWPQKARFAYRAAVFNNTFLEQPVAASAYLHRLIEIVKAEDEEPDADDTPLSRADRAKSKNYNTAATDEGLAKAFMMYGNILKKQGELESAMSKYLEALPHTIFNMQLQSEAARRLGEVQEHLGFLQEAQQSLDLAVQSVLPHHKTGTAVVKLDSSTKHSPELLASIKSLALFRARQGKLKDSLASLLSLLQYQQQHPATHANSCDSAATMANIAELVWALGDPNECLRWTNKSLDLCTTGKLKDDRYCLECAGINHNMLGLLNLKDGQMANARAEFGRAIVLAERADDWPGEAQYSQNLNRCEGS